MESAESDGLACVTLRSMAVLLHSALTFLILLFVVSETPFFSHMAMPLPRADSVFCSTAMVWSISLAKRAISLVRTVDVIGGHPDRPKATRTRRDPVLLRLCEEDG